MKKLLDRLMARQMRLMTSLGDDRPAPQEAPSALASPARSSLRRPPADPAAEATARSNAAALAQSGDLKLAREALEPFLVTGNDLQTLIDLSRICTEQGDLAHALAALQRAEEIAPADTKVWRLMAKLLSAQRRFREAVVYLRRLAFSDPQAPAQSYVHLLKAMQRALTKGKPAKASELKLIRERFEAAPELDDSARLQFAAAYYLLSGDVETSLRLYNAGMPRQLGERDVSATVMSLTQWSQEQQLAMPRLNDEGVAGRRPTLHQLADALIFPDLGWIPVLGDGTVLPSGFPIVGSHYRIESSSSPLLMFRGSQAELRLPGQVKQEPGPAVLLGGSDSYYDNALLHAGALAILEGVGGNRQLPLVVNKAPSRELLELLDLLGYRANPQVRIAADQPVRFDALHAPSRLALGAEWIDPLLARWYRSRLSTPAADAPTRKLYVRHAATGGVTLDNEGAVAELAIASGYEAIDTTGWAVKDQIETFSGASHVVGATTEALTNLLFCSPGTSVVELRAVNWVAQGGRMHFDRLAQACGHRYTAVECSLLGIASDTTPVLVDIEQLRIALQGETP
jgi:tetratricopeptide (TPR) repeat protein